MASLAKIADNSIDVRRRAALGDGQAAAVVVKEKPAGGATGTGLTHATGIEGTDTLNEAIGGNVGMAACDDIGTASGQQRSQLLIGDARFDPWAVVGSG